MERSGESTHLGAMAEQWPKAGDCLPYYHTTCPDPTRAMTTKTRNQEVLMVLCLMLPDQRLDCVMGGHSMAKYATNLNSKWDRYFTLSFNEQNAWCVGDS